MGGMSETEWIFLWVFVFPALINAAYFAACRGWFDFMLPVWFALERAAERAYRPLRFWEWKILDRWL